MGFVLFSWLIHIRGQGLLWPSANCLNSAVLLGLQDSCACSSLLLKVCTPLSSQKWKTLSSKLAMFVAKANKQPLVIICRCLPSLNKQWRCFICRKSKRNMKPKTQDELGVLYHYVNLIKLICFQLVI